MNRKSIYCAAAIAAVMALGAMAGCSGQQASSAAAPSAAAPSAAASASASAAAEVEKSQEEIIADLKAALENVPAYKSVTITEKTLAWMNAASESAVEDSDAASASSESASASAESASAASAEAEAPDNTDIEVVTVYKFDESGDKPKTSSVLEDKETQMEYYSEGDDVVCVSDGTAYSGTAEQFETRHTEGAEAYLKNAIGDLDAFVDCIDTVSEGVIEGVNGFELILDAKKAAEVDEELKTVAEVGSPAKDVYITVGFDDAGRIAWMTRTCVFDTITSSTLLDLTDYDSTVVDPLPEASKTYEDLAAELQ